MLLHSNSKIIVSILLISHQSLSLLHTHTGSNAKQMSLFITKLHISNMHIFAQQQISCVGVWMVA